MTSNRRNSFKIAIAIIFALLVIYWLFHMQSKNTAPPVALPKVLVQRPKTLSIADYVTQTGNTVAFNSVNLVARVEGYLDNIQFVDGSFVKKNQLLFVIEPDPYLDKVDEAKANIAASKAGLAYAKAEHERQKQMYKENATALKNVEIWQSKEDESQAEVLKAEANARIAEINYSYTHVLSPFDGRIGRHLVDAGNLVGHGEATNLATVEQINPIYVYFNLNELDLIKLRAAAKSEGISPQDINQIPVYVRMQNEEGFPHQGKLNFVNTGLNASTGTMQFRALLENKDYQLVPGLFVQVKIPISKSLPQLTVPDTAVQYDQIGPYLLTIGEDNYVQLKRVKLGSLEQGLRAITQGIDKNDWVIVDGLQFATQGQKVNPKKVENN